MSITSPPGVYAGISVFAGTNGVDITGPSTVVVLRGLSINGQGGDIGIAFTQGLRLYVEHCIVANMSSRGISAETGDAYITDSTIRGNSSYGIWAEGAVTVAVDRSRIERTNFTGMRILTAPRWW